ncbi:MAG: YraN family protein [Treponema sp.]|nr:YraN family protein [Treponema sp.]
MRKDNKTTGSEGENRAYDYLKSKDFEIIARNWRIKGGEIDLIAKKGETIVFFEVKTLPNATLDMLKAVLGPQKQQRIIKTSKRFLQINRQYSNYFVRFDVIIFDMQDLPPVYHIENAFSEHL